MRLKFIKYELCGSLRMFEIMYHGKHESKR